MFFQASCHVLGCDYCVDRLAALRVLKQYFTQAFFSKWSWLIKYSYPFCLFTEMVTICQGGSVPNIAFAWSALIQHWENENLEKVPIKAIWIA